MTGRIASSDRGDETGQFVNELLDQSKRRKNSAVIEQNVRMGEKKKEGLRTM